MKSRITLKQVLLVFALIVATTFGHAQESKISADLSAMVTDQAEEQTPAEQRRSDARTSGAVPVEFTPINNIQVFDGRVVIEAIAKDDASALLAELQTMGLENGSYFGGLVSGLFPLKDIMSLQSVEALRYVRPAYKPSTNVGDVTSQGDFVQYSDAARAAFGVDGTGYRVGVVSDSWNNRGGQAAGIASGDLPEDIVVLQEFPFGSGSDEGRGMGELIYDVAPGVSLAFHTAFLGQADFANGILELAAAGSDVIVDDIIYFAEPMFQDGIIGQAADMVAKDGVPYFSSAGNQEDASYESTFNPSSEPKNLFGFNLGTGQFVDLGNYLLHDFDEGEGEDFYQRVNFPGSLLLSFQWTDPFASVCAGCPGAENDFDIFLATVDGDETSIIYFDGNGQGPNIGLDAVEILGLSTGGALQAFLVIGKKVTEDPGSRHKSKDPKDDEELIKYVVFNDVVPSEYMNQSGTSYGHANAERAVSVGAVRYDATPEFGVNPPIREFFSSSGGVPTYFDTEGKQFKKPKVRKKPEISAVQGTNTTFFGFDYEPDGFPNFFGTSASAPHAAGVAALMLEATDGKIKPDKITKAMQKTAIDMDDPRTPDFDKGFDFGTGYGFLQADAAVASVVDIATVYRYLLIDPISDTPLRTLRDGETIELTDDEYGVFNIEALVSEGKKKVKKVKFELESEDPDFKKYKRSEKKPPFALFGEKKGDYKEGTLPVGDYVLETKLEAKKGKKKDKYITDILTFSIDVIAPIAPVAAARSADNGVELDSEQLTTMSEKLLNASELVVYPNPSTGIVNFIWNAGQEDRVELSIMDISGRLVEVFQAEGAFEHSIDFSRYDRGIHIARIITPNFTEVQRFVIK